MCKDLPYEAKIKLMKSDMPLNLMSPEPEEEEEEEEDNEHKSPLDMLKNSINNLNKR